MHAWDVAAAGWTSLAFLKASGNGISSPNVPGRTTVRKYAGTHRTQVQPRARMVEILLAGWRCRVRYEEDLAGRVRFPIAGVAAANGLDSSGGGRQARLLGLAGQRRVPARSAAGGDGE